MLIIRLRTGLGLDPKILNLGLEKLSGLPGFWSAKEFFPSRKQLLGRMVSQGVHVSIVAVQV